MVIQMHEAHDVLGQKLIEIFLQICVSDVLLKRAKKGASSEKSRRIYSNKYLS